MTKGQGHTLIAVACFILAAVDQPHDWGTAAWTFVGLVQLFLASVEK